MANFKKKEVKGLLRTRKLVIAVLLVLTGTSTVLHAQENTADTTITATVKDIGDVISSIFKKNNDNPKKQKQGGVSMLPSLGYNPSFGFVIGARITGSRQLGSIENTNLSLYGLQGSYSSRGIITVQARHNIFTSFNKWNYQGNWQVSRLGMVDYGIGTGNSQYRSRGFSFNDLPTKNADSAFPIKYTYIRLFEKIYRRIGPHLFAGAGISLDIFSKIKDEKRTAVFSTPHSRYSTRNEFSVEKYSANGLLIALQYNTTEHPVRSYGGVYADISFRFNQEWIGSTKDAVQVEYDFRKYWSLSKQNQEQVIAFWHWASYRLSGKLPYLNLPSTASDTYSRSGRAYTAGRFKGPSYAYFETEYRFPITRNKLLGGVCFVNMQSASDDINKKIFSSWAPGIGAGLRILFQKESRTALCIDFAKGRYNSSGIFFGLSEVF